MLMSDQFDYILFVKILDIFQFNSFCVSRVITNRLSIILLFLVSHEILECCQGKICFLAFFVWSIDKIQDETNSNCFEIPKKNKPFRIPPSVKNICLTKVHQTPKMQIEVRYHVVCISSPYRYRRFSIYNSLRNHKFPKKEKNSFVNLVTASF